MPTLGSPVTFECGNGGRLSTTGLIDSIEEVGVEDGWAILDDIHIDAHEDMTVGLTGGDFDSDGQHLTGVDLAKLEISPVGDSATFDLRIIELKEGSTYEFLINGDIAAHADGVTRATADSNGEIVFNEVEL